VSGGAGLLPCPDCGRLFQDKAGVSLHRRCAHPEAYHAKNAPKQHKKVCWEYKEKALLARQELTLREGVVVNSKSLAARFPS